MKITYDKEADAIYITFIETTINTEHIAKDIALDYTKDGNLAGIEILNAKENIGDLDTLQKVLLENIGLYSSV